jgi:hypothetical protein
MLLRCVLLFASLPFALALVRLPAHLSSGAILQTWRGSHTATKIYGTAAPGEVVTVAAAVPGVPPFSATADSTGAWTVAYNWPPGPTDWSDFDITISGTATPAPLLLAGVRWGDVVTCVGDGSALLPLSLAAGGAAWAANMSSALASIRLFPASVGGACAWGGGAAPGPPCDAWTSLAASRAPALGFSAACLQVAAEATRARGFGGNTVVGVIALAANASAIEDWLPPAGVAAAAACPPLPGGPAAPGTLWAAAGAPLASFPTRYFALSLGGGDAARAGAAAAAAGGGGAPGAAAAYGCRVRALVAGLRAGAAVGDAVALLLEPLPGAAPAGAAEGFWAIRAGLALALPGSAALGAGADAVALAGAPDADAGGAGNAGGARAGTATAALAARAAPALAHTAWWAFAVAAAGPRAVAAAPAPGGAGVDVAFAFAPDAGAASSTLALAPARGCAACCARASAAFQTAPAAGGPWTNAAPALAPGARALRLPAAAWVRVGAADARAPECLLVDAATGVPAPAFAMRVAGARGAAPAASVAATAADTVPPRAAARAPALPHAAAPLAPGAAPRRAYLLEAASRVAAVAATPRALRYAGLAATPPRYFNTWQAFRCNTDENLMLAAGEVLVASGLAALGFDSVNSDDCEYVEIRAPRCAHRPRAQLRP